MSFKKKLINELKVLGISTLYFVFCFGVLMLLKVLLLEEYNIQFLGVSMILIGALVVAKVILILEHVNFGSWIKEKPAFVDIIFRTLLYMIGVFIVLLLEKSFEGREEYGDFWSSFENIFNHVDINHVWVTIICVALAILGFNTLSVVNRSLGKGKLSQILFSTIEDNQIDNPNTN